MARAQRDPLWFCDAVLGAPLWQRQREIAQAVWTHRRTAVRACRRSGKTHVAARLALAFLFAWKRSVVLTTAPTFRQVQAGLWQEIHVAYRGARIPLGGELLQTALHVGEGWFALGLTASDPTAFQGLNVGERVLVIVDEASGLHPDIWHGIEGILAGAESRLLMIGNPTEVTGAFRDEFTRPGTAKMHISAFDTPNFTGGGTVVPGLITPEWVDERRHTWPEASMMWQAHILGEFPDRSTDSLIPLDWIVAAQRRTLEPKEHAPRILGVDVARYGEDRTVILERRGPVVRCRSVSQQEDTMQTAGRVAQALRETGASAAHVDVIGVGAGVVDRLREQGLPVVPVNVGEAAWDSERFTNRRAECFWALRERFEAEAIDLDPADEELAAQLSALKYKFDSRGRILIESKDDMRKRGMASPDQADALMLACLPESLVTFDPAAVAAF